MLMVMPVQALIRNRIPASTQLPKFQVFIDFNCAAKLGEAAVLKSNGNCSGGEGEGGEGGGPPIIKKGATLTEKIDSRPVLGLCTPSKVLVLIIEEDNGTLIQTTGPTS